MRGISSKYDFNIRDELKRYETVENDKYSYSYTNWKRYIADKYSAYTKEELDNFKFYLRKLKSEQENYNKFIVFVLGIIAILFGTSDYLKDVNLLIILLFIVLIVPLFEFLSTNKKIKSLIDYHEEIEELSKKKKSSYSKKWNKRR